MKAILPVFFIFSVALNTCYKPIRYHTGVFPDTPVNMGEINSVYDDYNSTFPLLGGTAPLCFSSNRASMGGNFDLVYMLLDVYFNKYNGKITVEENKNANMDIYSANINLYDAVNKAKTAYDELGPYLIPMGTGNKKVGYGYQTYQNYILMYSSKESGNSEIKFTEDVSGSTYSAPKDIVFLNSSKEDAYPTLTKDSLSIYFCSDRGGNFDIFKADLVRNKILLKALSDSSSATITKDMAVSSEYNDKCPFISGNLMVFTSDRPGGYGGYDLYYSRFKDGKWSSPVNFGNKINTQYDEYRPIVKPYQYDFSNDFMIFSSNRPGGKGGFDLYYVGIPKMSE
jgi:hypothetical protein